MKLIMEKWNQFLVEARATCKFDQQLSGKLTHMARSNGLSIVGLKAAQCTSGERTSVAFIYAQIVEVDPETGLLSEVSLSRKADQAVDDTAQSPVEYGVNIAIGHMHTMKDADEYLSPDPEGWRWTAYKAPEMGISPLRFFLKQLPALEQEGLKVAKAYIDRDNLEQGKVKIFAIPLHGESGRVNAYAFLQRKGYEKRESVTSKDKPVQYVKTVEL